jgi:hypothetical protein
LPTKNGSLDEAASFLLLEMTADKLAEGEKNKTEEKSLLLDGKVRN